MNVVIANRVRVIVTAIAAVILLYALTISATHIAHVGHFGGLRDFEANSLFILIDIPIVVGKLMALPYFAPTTKRTGKRLIAAGLVVSLGCNVGSGLISGGYGPAAYGAFVVGMAFLMEHTISKIRPAAAVTKARNTATEKATPATPNKATRARKPKAPAAAPVSPATVREIDAIAVA